MDKIFKATNESNKPKQQKIPSYSSSSKFQSSEDNLKGRNLANDAISSERKKGFFQNYVFDTYKHQSYFLTSTEEIMEKIHDALWPFHPDNQPEALKADYEKFCHKMSITT